MTSTLVGVQGHLAGRSFPLSDRPLTLGRGPTNDVVLADPAASRAHAEVRMDADGCLLKDLGSGNGTFVNGERVTTARITSGDRISIGNEVFRLLVDSPTVLVQRPVADDGKASSAPVLRVTVAGGGPVGMSLALLLDHLLGERVAVTIHDGRWTHDGERFVWQNPEMGNNRRQQVVTVQSRQFLKLPPEVQERLFQPGTYTEMWPAGPDSIQGQGPRNIRIAYIEDELLAILNEKADRIRLVTENFDATTASTAPAQLADQHVLAICEGGKSATREHFAGRFGAADVNLYGLEGKQVQDMVLGLRVKSRLPDPMSVLLTVSQNRFLLNALSGDGFLNMRLTDQEALEAVGINPVRQVFTPCIQSTPCLLERRSSGEFHCGGHNAVFLPALLKGSALWERVQEGLTMYDVPAGDLSAVTGFRLDMVQRPRFTAELLPRTASTPGTYGFLLGDSANAIHFWPGRGLNSGLASAISLARCLATTWRGEPFRDSAFTRHEAVMAMLQYRHKTRAFRQMVTTDDAGNAAAIKDLIGRGITEGEQGHLDRERDIELLMQRMRANRSRLATRMEGLPDDATLRPHLDRLSAETLHTLVVSDQWDSANVGGEEVDVDWLLPAPEEAAVPQPRRSEEPAAASPAGWQPIVV